VWLPTVGWIGLDPTNNLVAGERHIRVAVGRDYADVPPVRGVFKGGAESGLHVAVRVEQAEPDAPDAIAPTMAWPPTLSGELRQQHITQSQSQSQSDQSQSQQQ
jgi:transglutaminase-like putative cysteine protease